MSAPPPPKPNGPLRPPARGNPLRPMRKKPGNPLVARRPPRPTGPVSSAATSSKPRLNPQHGSHKTIEQRRQEYGGWSEPPPPGYLDIPIVTTKRAIMEGMRFHLMKFWQAKQDDTPIDPTDDIEFTRPVTLHRRDARQLPPGRVTKVEEQPAPLAANEEERERWKIEKEKIAAQRAIDQAKMAPVAQDNKPKPKKKQKEEKTRFERTFKSDAAKKESDIRYEEALPWHLEDVDGKNVWVGSYVAALSEHTVALVIEGSHFRMVPLEKWYKFTSKPPFKAFTLEQAEEFMNRKVDVSRWVMKNEETKAAQAELDATRRLLYGSGKMVKTESSTFRAASRAEKMEHDELDISGDEFQDDDENPNFDRNADDEDTKEAKERIRREQMGANLFGDGDEKEVDKELEAELREELERKKYGKATKKALIKRDRENIYESDNSEENPWSSSSESGSSDEEDEEKDKEETKESDSKETEKEKDKAKGTPKANRKHSDLKKGKLPKRAGSPAISESSGNESARKKTLKKTGTPALGQSRSGTPALQKRKAGAAGSGSDGEATAGEMSDGAGPKKKIKILAGASGSRRPTPAGSRAGSPNPPQGASRAGSPAIRIEPQEMLDLVPAGAEVHISDLVKHFKGRVGSKPGQMPTPEWIALVKQVLNFNQATKIIRRK